MASERVERRLTAILAADVAGYSRLMGADEEGTLAQLKAHRRALVDPKINEHRGRIVKTTGDGMLVEFASVVDAVRCAVDIQRGMIERNAKVPEEKRIELRIGINVGDIIIDGGDVFGDGVNVAARLEGIADTGGVCVSNIVHDQIIHNKLDLVFEDRGEQHLKNIERPVRAYSLGSEAIAALPPVKFPILGPVWSRSKIAWQAVAGLLVVFAIAAGGAVWHFRSIVPTLISSLAPTDQPQLTTDRLSIVVLPFTNLSGDSTQDYLADVITEELTTNLSRISGTFVIARSTAFTYKGKSVDAKQIGKDLGVHYVLEGSTQQSGNRVRINAQLINAETGAHLWADQFDTDRADLLQMQDEIVTSLGRVLEIQLWKVNSARVARSLPGNPNAEDLALKCWADLYIDNPFKADFSLCERALQIDPRNARALTMMAWKSIEPVLNMQSTDPQGDIRRADELATRAIVVEPNLYLAHHNRAWVLIFQKRPEEAIIEAERSLALNPSFIDAYGSLVLAHQTLGHYDKALEYAEKAFRQSPHDPLVPGMYAWKAVSHFGAQRYEQAIANFRQTLAAWPEWPTMHMFLAAALALNGNEPEARETLKHYLSLPGVKTKTISALHAQGISLTCGNPSCHDLGKRLEDGLRRAGMPEE